MATMASRAAGGLSTADTAGTLLTIALSTVVVHSPLAVSLLLAVLGAYTTYKSINSVRSVFVRRGRSGKDLLKKDRPEIPESTGAIVGVIYFICMFIFIPIPFLSWFESTGASPLSYFPHDRFSQLLGGLLSLFSMLFLGFADDILDIRWRVKIWFPFIASLPLLVVYFVTYGGTDVLIPRIVRAILPDALSLQYIHLGPFYYMYLAALSVFSTNAINILAGVNGVEAGQSLIIALSIIANDLLQLYFNPHRRDAHLLSLFFLIPFVGVTLGFLKQNWYPAKAFPGDTYCYFAGMIFSVVAIMGNFSKTLLLFMMPQIFNFLFSCPQLFHFVDCPRHRMPVVDPDSDLLVPSRMHLRAIQLVKPEAYTTATKDSSKRRNSTSKNAKDVELISSKTLFQPGQSINIFSGTRRIVEEHLNKSKVSNRELIKLLGVRKFVGLIMIWILQFLSLTDVRIQRVNRKTFFVNELRLVKSRTPLESASVKSPETLGPNFDVKDWCLIEYAEEESGDECIITCSNFTLINLVLVKFGPLSEPHLATAIIIIQMCFSALAFFVRYYLSRIIYNDTKAFH